MEGRAGQPPLQVVRGVTDVVDQRRVVVGRLGDRQGGRPGQHRQRGEHRAPGRRECGQASPPQPVRQRQEQRGEQQRRHARQYHQAQDAGHPERRVQQDAEDQQAPRPARGPLQPAGYPGLLAGLLVLPFRAAQAVISGAFRIAGAAPPLRRPGPWCRARSVAPSCPHVTNYRGLMRVYHERLRVPLSWWLVGLATIALLATEVVPGWPLPVEAAIYVVLVGVVVALLLNWGRPSVDVGAGELRVGKARLPLAAVGEVTALDEAQTRSLRGPRGRSGGVPDHQAVSKESGVCRGHRAGCRASRCGGRGGRGVRGRAGRRPRKPSAPACAAAPYWLVGTRHPAELAAAINGARPAARADGAAVG